MKQQKHYRRMTRCRAAYLTARSDTSASRTLLYVDKKSADPYPADYADFGVDLTGLSVSGVRLADVYVSTTGRYL